MTVGMPMSPRAPANSDRETANLTRTLVRLRLKSIWFAVRWVLLAVAWLGALVLGDYGW